MGIWKYQQVSNSWVIKTLKRMAIESESALIFAITKKYHLFFSTPYKVTTIGVQKNNCYNNKKLRFKPSFSHKRE